MPKYIMYATKTMELEIVVEAESADEALRIADYETTIDDFTEVSSVFNFEPYSAFLYEEQVN